MTVNYMQAAATAKVGTFLKLLFRWRGSVWKIVWKELTIFLFLYFNLSVAYRFFLKGNEFGVTFERVVRHCRALSREAATVLSFAMGFYVAQISGRWWKVFMTIPWPDTTALLMCAFIRSRNNEKQAETDRIMRRTMMRYFILSYVLVFRDISERIRRRFPTYNHLIPTLLTEAEKERIEKEDIKRVYWMPIEWAMRILKKFYDRGQIDEHHFAVLCQSIAMYREMMHNILSFDWINVPLVYTQVVHICILAYFGIICFASQPISEETRNAWIQDFVIPGYAVYEFIFFVGWLKVAQVMLNPFGMDEDDFEIDMLVERNLQVGYSYVDTMYDRLPPLVRVDVTTLPHTKASMALIPKATPMVGSVANVHVPQEEQQIISKEDVELIRKLVGPKFGRRLADYVGRTRSVEKTGANVDEKWTKKTDQTEFRKKASEHLTGTTAMGLASKERKNASRMSRVLLRTCKSLQDTPKGSMENTPENQQKAQKYEELDATQSSKKYKAPTEKSRIGTMQSTQYSLHSSAEPIGEQLMRNFATAGQPRSAGNPSLPNTAHDTMSTEVAPYKSRQAPYPSLQPQNVDVNEKAKEKTKSRNENEENLGMAEVIEPPWRAKEVYMRSTQNTEEQTLTKGVNENVGAEMNHRSTTEQERMNENKKKGKEVSNPASSTSTSTPDALSKTSIRKNRN